MRENQLSFNDVLNYFGSDKIEDRYMFLYDKMAEYIKARGLEEELFINSVILQQAIMDYFVDIYYLKEYHRIDKTDMMKILAYESYWVMKRRPIQSIPSKVTGVLPDHIDERHVYANEGFVATLIAHELLFPEVNEPMSEEEEEALMDFLRHMHYHLKYRNVDKQALEMMIHSFQLGRKLK